MSWPTKGIEDIERQEFAEGRVLLAQKLEELKPHVVAFNGKMVYGDFPGGRASWACKRERWMARGYSCCLPRSGQNAGTERGVKMRYFKKLAALLKSLKN